MNPISHSLENYRLPGPRGNLELLYAFAHDANREASMKCLEFIRANTKNWVRLPNSAKAASGFGAKRPGPLAV